MIVSFPNGSGCKSFSVPIDPSPETLATWKLINKVGFFAKSLDGYISQSASPSAPASAPSDILSVYFGKPVHLLFKGPRVRPVDPTYEFPDLKASSLFQDEYPILVLSEESTGLVDREIRDRVGTIGIDEAWRTEKIQIRR